MNRKVIFTICAKNYLAQALALKVSIEETNPGIDFYIFISDTPFENDIENLVFLDDSWIPKWRSMSFKYNVIEFSTSIKPFCINYLFKTYTRVVYLDPDIYVTADLQLIFETLEEKDIMITPHYCEIQENYTGSVSEEELLFVGIYNLGFLAIANSEIGNRVIRWWMNRLENKCFADKHDALHVDQKWFDFIPAFFPDNTKISHHFGINTAIWNLHERELIIQSDKYFVLNKISGEEFPLLFFHFSGFNPQKPELINRRHPKYNVTAFPTFKTLFSKYTELVLQNKFAFYSEMNYGFNAFNNDEKITPLHRRLFRSLEHEIEWENPYDETDATYRLLKDGNFLLGEKIKSVDSNPNIRHNRDSQIKKGILFLKIIKRLLGVKYYNYLLVFFSEYHRLDRQYELINKKFIDKYRKV